MSKFSQLLKMINYLEGKQEPTTRKEIAEYLGVSDRMIRKYLDDIKESECYNITSISGVKGGIILNHKEPRIQDQKSLLNSYEKFYLEMLLNENKKEVIKEIEFIAGTLPSTQKLYEVAKEHLEKQLKTIELLKIKLNL